MENVTRDKAFWREQLYAYMIRNKLTLAETAERLGMPYPFVTGILYKKDKNIGYKTMNILMKVLKENEEAKENEQK